MYVIFILKLKRWEYLRAFSVYVRVNGNGELKRLPKEPLCVIGLLSRHLAGGTEQVRIASVMATVPLETPYIHMCSGAARQCLVA
jgi:hypothetical protein